VDCDFETSISALFSKPENRMKYDSNVLEAKIVEKGFVEEPVNFLETIGTLFILIKNQQ
jgi:hypothetical protein